MYIKYVIIIFYLLENTVKRFYVIYEDSGLWWENEHLDSNRINVYNQ